MEDVLEVVSGRATLSTVNNSITRGTVNNSFISSTVSNSTASSTVNNSNISTLVNSSTESTPMESVLSHDLCENMEDDHDFSETRRQNCVMDNVYLWLGIVAVAVCIIVNWVVLEAVTDRMKEDIKEGLVLREPTSADWTQPKFTAFVSLHDFDLGKPEDGLPSVSENGLYVYRLEISRMNVTWHRNFSVSYRELHTMFFEQRLSSGPTSSYIRYIHDMVLWGATNIECMFNVYTGEVNFDQIYQIFSWNFATKLPFWNSEDANRIRGTDGSKFPPFLNENSELTFFYPLLKRTFDLQFSESTTYKDLPVYRFNIPDSEFSNTTRSSRNKASEKTLSNHGNSRQSDELSNGYCAPSCVPSGMYNIPQGSHDAPLYISLPHFLGADPYYRQLVSGVQPDESKHRPFFEVDKVTGITVNQKRRFQVNVHQRSENNSSVYLPMYWFQVSIEINDDDLQHLKNVARSLSMISDIRICVALGLCFAFAGLVSGLIYRIVKKRTGTIQYVRFEVLSGRCPCQVSHCC